MDKLILAASLFITLVTVHLWVTAPNAMESNAWFSAMIGWALATTARVRLAYP